MKKLIGILAIGVLALTSQVWALDSCQIVCRHEAVMMALAMGEHGAVRIAYGHVKGRPSDEQHVQAQAYINGKWEWLGYGCHGIVAISDKDFGNNFTVSGYFTVGEFIEMFFKQHSTNYLEVKDATLSFSETSGATLSGLSD